MNGSILRRGALVAVVVSILAGDCFAAAPAAAAGGRTGEQPGAGGMDIWWVSASFLDDYR